MFNQRHIKVFTAQKRIAIGGFHFENAIANFQNGNVKCAAAQIINRNGLPVIFIQAISQRGSCRLVNNAQHFQTGNFTGIFGGLTLGVVKIGRYGNDRLVNFFAQIIFGGFFHFLQNKSRNL